MKLIGYVSVFVYKATNTPCVLGINKVFSCNYVLKVRGSIDYHNFAKGGVNIEVACQSK